MKPPVPEPAEAYLLLRSRILNLDPHEMGLTPTKDLPHVWGVVMETGYEVGTATLISLADGTTSLYYSTGGGMLGSGEYQPVAQAAKALVAQAENQLKQMAPTTELPLPEAGWVRFTILTYSGALAAGAEEEKLSSGKHRLSPLYVSAQETLSQLRILAEKKRKTP